jgi:hypothetical protein
MFTTALSLVGWATPGLKYGWRRARFACIGGRAGGPGCGRNHGALGRSSRGSQRRRCSTERDELMEACWLFAQIERRYRYLFTHYLPADFPIVPTRLVLAQWNKYVNGGGAGHRIRCSRYGIGMGNCRLRGMMMRNQFSIPLRRRCAGVGSIFASRRDSRVARMG